MKQIKLAFVLLTIMIVLGNCTFENRTTTTKMCLEDLDMNVQDTLRNLPVDSLGPPLCIRSTLPPSQRSTHRIVAAVLPTTCLKKFRNGRRQALPRLTTPLHAALAIESRISWPPFMTSPPRTVRPSIERIRLPKEFCVKAWALFFASPPVVNSP